MRRLILAVAFVSALLAAGPARAQSTQVCGTTTTGCDPIHSDGGGNLRVTAVDGTPFSCVVTVSTATTIQAVGGGCAAPGAGLSIYITDIVFASNAAGIAADSFNTLKSGTGGTCGSNTAVIWGAFSAAATQASVVQSLATPIKVAANSEVCWINSTAGSKFLVLNGFVAP